MVKLFEGASPLSPDEVYLGKVGSRLILKWSVEVFPNCFMHLDNYTFGSLYFILSKLAIQDAKSFSEVGRWLGEYKMVVVKQRGKKKGARYDSQARNTIFFAAGWRGGLVNFREEDLVPGATTQTRVWITEKGKDFLIEFEEMNNLLAENDLLKFAP